MKKRFLVAITAALLAVAMFNGVALAHVHGITPLKQITVDNPNSGGVAVNTTPASASNGGPIAGLIPRDVGQAPLTGGDGGFGATGDNAP